MEIIHVNFKTKNITHIDHYDIVREAEEEFDFLMNLGEDDEDAENRHAISSFFGQRMR